MKIGDVMFTNKFEAKQGFGSRVSSATFKANPDRLLGYIYIGGVSPDTLPSFKPDGVLMALGYGPILQTFAQKALVDALKQAKEFEQHPGGSHLPDGEWFKLHEQIDDALAQAKSFDAAVSPTLSPVLQDAARFNALVKKLEQAEPEKVFSLQVLLGVASTPVEGLTPREQVLALIDAATK